MKRTIAWRAWLLMAASSLALTTAHADTVYDTFSTKWRPISVGSGTTSEMVRNRLEVSLDADATNESGRYFASGLYGTCAVSGDFDLRTAFRLLDWPEESEASVALNLGTLSEFQTASGISIERKNDTQNFPFPSEVYVFDPGTGVTPQEHSTGDQSGVLRLRRIGSVVTGYYRSDGNWVEIGSSTVGTQDLRFSLIVYGDDRWWRGVDVRAAFDSVRLTKGTLTGAACPSSMSTTALAETIYDTFATKWRPISLGSGTTSEMVRNRLEVSIDADAGSEDEEFFASGLFGTCAVSGDFDLRAVFRLLDWQMWNGAKVALHLGTHKNLIDERGIFMERASVYNFDDAEASEEYNFSADINGGRHNTGDQSGILRLRRIGSVVTGYYWKDGDWVELGSTAARTQDLRFSILVYGHYSAFAGDTDVRAAFDSVRLTEGTLTGPACPFVTS